MATHIGSPGYYSLENVKNKGSIPTPKDDAAKRAVMTTNVANPDMLSPLCARGRLVGRLSRVPVCRRSFGVHDQTPDGDREGKEVCASGRL